MHNLVLETTRLGIEVKNLKMRVESMSSRLDFDERRARALEGVVQYRPGAAPPLQPPSGGEQRPATHRPPVRASRSERRTRRRRRRGRRRPGDREGRPESQNASPPAAKRQRSAARRPMRPNRRQRAHRLPPRLLNATRSRRNANQGDGASLGRVVRLAVVVQRYGADINGGAELHARYIAERLSRHAEVEVVTTCARDYVTWRNELPAGTETVNGVTVRRFPVHRERDPREFGRRSQRVFEHPHSIADELAWLDSEGPASPALVDHVARSAVRLRPVLQLPLLPRVSRARRVPAQGDPRADRRARSGDRRCRSSARSFAASAPSCTTRTKNAR